MPRISKTKWGRPQVSIKDIYSYIANNTSLTTVQVKECFEAYRDMVYSIAMSDFVDVGLKIPFPSIGSFQFFKRKGLKKGSTYTNIGYYNERQESNEKVVRDKDTEAYYLLRLKLYPNFVKSIKEKTKFFEVEE